MEERVNARLTLEARLRDALSHNKFALYYQPLLDLEADRLARLPEALLRLRDDDGAPVYRRQSLSRSAEKMEPDRDMDRQLRQRSTRRRHGPPCSGPTISTVAVANLSPLQFESGNLVATVKSPWRASGLDPHRLELEVTEGILDRRHRIRAGPGSTLSRRSGISIALDDFGTGYSSLSYLWMFPFDRVKVDRSFISRLSDEDAKSREVLSSILALGRSLEMSITAEGVETVEQSAIVKAIAGRYRCKASCSAGLSPKPSWRPQS